MSTRSSQMASAIFLINSLQVPGSCVRVWMGIPALPQPKYVVRTQGEANSLPPETCLVEDLAPICRKTHFLSKSLHFFLIYIYMFDYSHGSVWHWVWVYLKRVVLIHFHEQPLFYLRSINWNENESQEFIHRLIEKCIHHATTSNQSYKSWPLQPSGYSSQNGSIISYYN